MKLTKVNVTEGIKLSDVKDKTWIYEKRSDYIKMECYSEDFVSSELLDRDYCIIENNQVIPIIKNEEYNNEKPYIVKKHNIIVGLIEKDNNDYYSHLMPQVDILTDGTINSLILNLNKNGFEVYKQE